MGSLALPSAAILAGVGVEEGDSNEYLGEADQEGEEEEEPVGVEQPAAPAGHLPLQLLPRTGAGRPPRPAAGAFSQPGSLVLLPPHGSGPGQGVRLAAALEGGVGQGAGRTGANVAMGLPFSFYQEVK